MHFVSYRTRLEICSMLCLSVHLPVRRLCAFKEQAFEESQKYKEGKFIIEKARVMKVSRINSFQPSSSYDVTAGGWCV